MANMIMASSTTAATTKSLMAPPPPPSSPPSSPPSIPTLKFPKIQLPKPLQFSSIVAATLAMAPPSLAEEFEKAQLFDFDATLPIIAAEFLILMVALDKLYYSPLGNFMDQRDKSIREKLGSVKDTSAEVKQLEEQAAAVMKAARVEISAALNKMKKETQAEVEVKVAEGRKKVEAELAEALASLEKQKEETMKALDAQIDKLSDDIVKKVLPVS